MTMKLVARLWLLMICSGVEAAPLLFQNFGETIELQKEGQHYLLPGTNHRVEVASRLIVKVSPTINPGDFSKAAQAIGRTSVLFEADPFRYVQITLRDSIDIRTAMKTASGLPGVSLVQPDILQLNYPSKSVNTSAPVVNRRNRFNLADRLDNAPGEGVRVAIIDDGFDLSHPALSHIDPIFEFDLSRRQMGAAPVSPQDTHGTQVAGVIFALYQHDARLNGLAPQAQFIALRQPDSWTSNSLLAFQLAALAGADVLNCSWHTDLLLEPVADAVNSLSKEGRDGRGMAVVFASGNENRIITADDNEASIDSAIVVGAADHQGKRLPFSNHGNSIDLMAPGTPVSTTQYGGGQGPFGGTSLSAAIVTGTAALILSEQPTLSLQNLKLELDKIFKRYNTGVTEDP
ncbi:S8 family peptidase [Marinimicrobium sp. ARAG 43.8]|uniref:S8 family peptidase n=1 Tax=Marinimicrobium sp. ARAG 43.8 TaxID=3418719 RepID=UPI003CEDD200